MVREPKPNIVIFLMDCVRPDHMSCYGYPVKTTPSIDALVKEGVLFRNAITTSGWTLPAHASLFTGVYPSVHGACRENLYLDSRYPTMAQILRWEGYETAGFSSVPYVSRETGLDRGYVDFYESFDKPEFKHRVNRYMIKYKIIRFLSFLFSSYAKETIPGKIVNWKVSHWFKKRDISKPFFLFIHYIDAHKPYRYNSYYNKLFIRSDKKLAISRKISKYNWPFLTLNLEKIDEDVLVSTYDSKIFTVDYSISEILKYLKRLTLYDNTAIFILSDHGEIVTGAFEHHFFLTDEVLKIPLIIRFPNVFTQGEEKHELVSIVDILPTVMDLVGIKRNDLFSYLQGYSLIDPIKNDRFVVAEREKQNDPWINRFPELKNLNDIPPLNCVMRAVRTEKHKFICSSNGHCQLYDIDIDPEEKTNLIKEFPDIAEKLKSLLLSTINEVNVRTDLRKSSEVQNRIKSSLESLGYL